MLILISYRKFAFAVLTMSYEPVDDTARMLLNHPAQFVGLYLQVVATVKEEKPG